MRKKLFTLMTLLLTAVTGAWAEDVTLSNTPEGTTSFCTGISGYHEWKGEKTKNKVIYDQTTSPYTFMAWSNGNALTQDENGIRIGNSSKKSAIVFKVENASAFDIAVARANDATVTLHYLGTSASVLTDPNNMTPTGALSSVSLSSSNTSGNLTASGAAGYYMIFGTLAFTTKSIKVTEVTPHNVVVNYNGEDSYGTASAASTTVAEGGTTVITAVPAAGYKVTNWAVSGTGASISPDGASNSLTTTLTMGTADATVTCTFGAKSTYTVSNTLTNATKTSGATDTYELTEYTAVYAAADGYVLPSDITVTAGGSDITANCTWVKATGTLTIPAEYVTGDIAITVTGEVYVAPESGILYTLTFVNSSKVTMSNGDNLDLTATYATITGGTASISYFKEGNNNKDVLTSGKKITYGTNDMYLKLMLSDPLAVGDVITFAEGTGEQLAIATTAGTPKDQSSKVTTEEYNYTVTEGDVLVGKSILYVGRADASTTTHSVVTIMRPATITPSNTKTTYVTTQALDFTDVEGLKAYVATTSDASSVTLESVTAVPAGTPLVLKGTKDTEYKVPVVASASAPATNYLKAGPATINEGDAEHTRYVLSGGVFKKIVTDGVVIPTGKAYLEIDESSLAPELSLNFNDENNDVVTGINSVDAQKHFLDGEFYNLAGQRVSVPSKGLYIVNGKKVIVK